MDATDTAEQSLAQPRQFGNHRLSPAWLVATLVAMLGIQQLLLCRFLDWLPVWTYPLALLAIAGVCVALVRLPGWSGESTPSVRVFVAAALFATLLLLLGGEGRLFYANTDWQVRNSVLHDLVEYPWPFVYTVRATPDLLRAPLGMYLAPALVGKAWGADAADWALLAQNVLFLSILITLAATLFRDARSRWIALALFWGFSGMDVVGALLAGRSLLGHLEWWNTAQFSSEVTLAFWVPQHAFAGWTGAVLFLLWREKRLPLAALLTPLPLLAHWSPLGLLGAMPFAALAGIETLLRGRLRPADIMLPGAAVLFAVPGLLYLASGSAAVGGQANGLPLNQYFALEALEAVPILLAVAFLRPRFGAGTLALVAVLLLVVPFGQIGHHQDFSMRASITALAILALIAADVLQRRSSAPRPLWRAVLVGVLALGLVTPLSEIRRAVTYPPAPRMLCSYFGVVPGGADTYVTPLATVPRLIAPRDPARVRPVDPPLCYSGPWPDP